MENNKTQAMIERYLYAVTKRLPAAQRVDIEQELRGLIEDMTATHTPDAEPTATDIEQVLKQLGKPSDLAAKYRGEKRSLIGPDYYDTYIKVLGIVLAAVAGGLTLAMIIGVFADGVQGVWVSLGNFFAGLVAALFQAFGWVTIAFALAQKYNAKLDDEDKDWNPSELPEIPAQKAKIKRSEPIVGIVFTVVLAILLNTVPSLFGIYIFADTRTMIPLFDPTVFRNMLLIINAILALGIVKEILRLVIGRYTPALAAMVTLLNIACFALTIYVFLPPAIWNPDFMTSVSEVFPATLPEGIDVAALWSKVPRFFVLITMAGYALNTLETAVKAIRYGGAK